MGLACVPHSLFFGIPYTFVIRPPQIASFFSLTVACLRFSPASPPGPAPPVPRRYIILVRPRRGDLPLWLSIFIRIYGMEGINGDWRRVFIYLTLLNLT